MNINEKYEVIYAENNDGSYEKEEMTLLEIKEYKNKQIYVFRDSAMYEFVTYNHGDNIDWEFMNEINERFGYQGENSFK